MELSDPAIAASWTLSERSSIVRDYRRGSPGKSDTETEELLAADAHRGQIAQTALTAQFLRRTDAEPCKPRRHRRPASGFP